MFYKYVFDLTIYKNFYYKYKVMTDKVKLQLGDIIEVIAPNDNEIHNKTFYIEYIDDNKLRLEESTGKEVILTLTDGQFDNESIQSIIIKSRAEENGYARQNNLINGVWIDLFFNGDLPLTITGKITNLEEDKIEITTYPDNDVIFIDFEYKGIPEDLPIEKIKIRKAPETKFDFDEIDDLERQTAKITSDIQVSPETEFIEETEDVTVPGDEYIDIDVAEEMMEPTVKRVSPQEIKDQIKTVLFNADQIKFGEDLDAITQVIDVPEEEQRFDIKKQLDDMLDDLLSDIPNYERTDDVKNKINLMILRFKQLRDTFSVFDNKGFAVMPEPHGSNYKPLLKTIDSLEKKLHWIIPVAKNIKKLYISKSKQNEEDEDDDEEQSPEDGLIISLTDDVAEQENIIENYKTNNVSNQTSKYEYLQKELNQYQTPYINLTNPDDLNKTISNKYVNTNITAVVDNFGEFNSSVKGTDTYSMPNSVYKNERKQPVLQKRFLLQNYNVGNTGLNVTKSRGENPIIKRIPLTKNDKIDIISLLALPKPTVLFSRINTNTSSILEKSNLNLNYVQYWKLLNNNTKIYRTTINNIEKPYSHNVDKYLNKVRNYRIGDEYFENMGNYNEKEKQILYTEFLDKVIPRIDFIFNVIKPYITNNLSINEILKYMEPFMVYQNDISFPQYKDMVSYITDKIDEYKKKYLTKAREYSSIKGSQNVIIPSLIKVFDENPNLKNKVLDVYGFTDTIMQMKNGDVLKRIMEVDNGIFYNNAVGLITTNLMVADGTRDITDIDMYLNQEKSEIEQTIKKPGRKPKTALPQNTQDTSLQECSKIKTIAKRYIDIDDLMEDNGKEIFFDKKYDITPYDITDKFKVDTSLSIGEQIKFYMEKLIQTTKMDEYKARQNAEAIVKGQRIVNDGDYAILEITDDINATMQYYVRSNEEWILDDKIDAETFADTAKMFCNLNEKCISVKNTCTDENTGANEIKKQNLKLLLSEFDSNLNVNKDIVINKIEESLTNADSRIETLKTIQKIKLYKNDTFKVNIGNTLIDDSIDKRITSPYDTLLNAILEQSDISKRSKNICNFVSTFTREANVDVGENKYWFYCIKTNKQMLPTFIYKLANTFIKGHNYKEMLGRICAEQGTISEDGDKWIDKHSGYTIQMIDLNEAEEYNEEGFKIITHAVIEEDIGDIIMKKGNEQETHEKQKRKYSTADADKIYNVIENLSDNMGINIQDKYDYIVRNVVNQLTNTNVVPSKEKYQKIYKQLMEKKKQIDTYEDMYNSTLLYLTFSYFLISIQISIPPIKTKKTFPGCKRSFSGFPIEGTEDNTGLVYVACVAYKVRNTASLPWSSIKSRSATNIAKQMEVVITKYILPTEEIQNSIKEVAAYLIANPELDIPKEHNIEKWSNFLPPLKKLKMNITQDIGEVFKSKLTDSLRRGTSQQTESISEVKSKIRLFSFNIIKLIEEVVSKKGALLKTKLGEPFLQNACCDDVEDGNNNALHYFIKNQPEIAVLNNKVVGLTDIYDDINHITKASFLYDPSNTKRKLIELNEEFTENTIYRAFIVYCKFNSLTPLNDNLKAVCPTKPDNFNSNDTLEESIRKLKSNARNYNEHSLLSLINIINESTMKPIEIKEHTLTTSEKLSLIVNKIDLEETRPKVFRDSFIEILEQFELNSLTEDTQQMRKFKNILAKMNEDMQKEIIDFVKQNRKQLKKPVFKKFEECVKNIMSFSSETNKQDSNYKIINFMKKTLRSISKEFPNIIINGVNYDADDDERDKDEKTGVIKQINRIPKHWGLSSRHNSDLLNVLNVHYKEFKRFYDDKQSIMVMKKLLEKTNDIYDLGLNTLLYTPVEMKNKSNEKVFSYSVFDVDLTTMLFHFYYLTIFTDLISLQNDEEVLELPLVTSEEESNIENIFTSKENRAEILMGNKSELADKIAHMIIVFNETICKDKKAVNYNYKELEEVLLRSKEKEKDDMTRRLEGKNDEEREIDTLFKQNKLGEWSIGEQKGFRTYAKETYDKEMRDMEKMVSRENRLNMNNAVTNMNRDIYELDIIQEEATGNRIEHEENMITYMGEDAEPEEYDMDGDENY